MMATVTLMYISTLEVMVDGMTFKNAQKSKEIHGLGLDQDIFYSWFRPR